MKKLIILALLIISSTSCKNNTKEQETVVEKEVITTEEPTTMIAVGCYSYDANNNLIHLEITNLENGVIGKLTYALNEKDRNSGTFNGQLIEDKLIGEYTFLSEGVQSTREVAFMIKDNQLIEGFGELNETGTAFVDKSTIKYNSTMPLSKTDCNK